MKLKPIKLQDLTLYLEWRPEAVGRFLDEQQIRVEDLDQQDRGRNKQLSKELYLLAARASVSGNSTDREYAPILRHFARSLSQIKTETHTSSRRTTMHINTTPQASELPSLDGLQAHLFRLLTQYSLQPCQHVAAHIVQALTRLCQHPHIELVPEQRRIYCQSLNTWRAQLLPLQQGLSQQMH